MHSSAIAAFSYDLWPLTLKTFQQCQLTCWILVASFIEILQIDMRYRIMLMDGQTTDWQKDYLKTNCLSCGFFDKVLNLLLTKNSRTFPGLCTTPKTFFHDSVIAQQCQITGKQQLLTLYIQRDSTIHCKTFITSCKETVWWAHSRNTSTFIYTWCSIHKRHVG